MKMDIEASKVDPLLVVATMDFQSVLSIPQSAKSAFYYKRKLCQYNLTMYIEGGSREAYCFTWTEMDGKRGSSEIGSCSKMFLEEQSKKGKKKVKIWSDNWRAKSKQISHGYGNESVAGVQFGIDHE